MKVRTKFNPVEGVLKDRIVVMVDDSIVRGTTARQLVKMVRDAGAKEVHFRVASPPVINRRASTGWTSPAARSLPPTSTAPSTPSPNGWAWTRWPTSRVDGMMEAVEEAHDSRERYCNACFSGELPGTRRDWAW